MVDTELDTIDEVTPTATELSVIDSANLGEDMYGNHPETARGYVPIGRPSSVETFIGRGELRDEKHEAFAQAVAAGNSLTEAAKLSGFGDSHNGAANMGTRLMRIPAILARVTELRGAGDGESAVDVFVRKPFIIAQLVAIHYEGMKKKDLASACRAVEALSRIGGLDKPTTVTTKVSKGADGKTNLTAAIKSHISKLPRKDRLALLAAAPELYSGSGADPDSAAQAEVDGAE